MAPAPVAPPSTSSTQPASLGFMDGSSYNPTSGTQITPSNTITSAMLKPTQQISLPPMPTPSTAPATAAASAAATAPSLQDYISKLTPAPTEADQQQQSILNSIASLTGQDTGQQQFELGQEAANGVPQMQTDLTNLQGQQTIGTAALNQLNVQKTNALAAPAVNNSVAGPGIEAAQNTAVSRTYDAQIAAQSAQNAMVAAQIQAKTGNITTALTLAKNATDAKYAPIEDAIKVQQAQLAALQPILNNEQKTTALAQQQMLDDQKQAVQDAKDKETQLNTIAMNAAQAGASSDVISAIQNSPDVISAINAAAPALGAKAANDLKQQAFDNALQLRTAANDATRVAIEQENANINLAQLQASQNTASQSVANAVVTTPSGKKYVDGTGLDAAGKAAALNAGAIVLSGPQQQAMTIINNTQSQFGTLLTALQSSGVDLSKGTGATNGFLGMIRGPIFGPQYAAGNATPALRNFATSLTGTNRTGTDGLIASLAKLPNSGELVATLQNNIPKDTDSADVLNTKLTNIKSALDSAENGLLIDNSQPAQIVVNGVTHTLQADGTYN